MSLTPIKHPDPERVKKFIAELLTERGGLPGWQVDVLQFDFMTSAYRVKLMLNGNKAETKVMTEWLDEVWTTGDKFKRRKIRRALKDAVAPFAEIEE